MLKKFAVCAAVMASLYTASALAAPTLRVGSETTFPPFEFVDVKTKQFVGYEIDLINAVGKKAGYNISVQSMGFDAIIPALMTGTVDVGVSGMTITPERKKKVDFTVPVFKGGLVAVVRQKDAAAYKTPAAIKGKQVCAQLGTTGQLKAEEISGKKARTFNNAAEAMMELRNGGCDAVVADKPVIEYFLKESRQSSDMAETSRSFLPSETRNQCCSDLQMRCHKKNAHLLHQFELLHRPQWLYCKH